ncbi:MAG: NB-ARC domain-containing protein [Promethearchaeota archaeon]
MVVKVLVFAVDSLLFSDFNKTIIFIGLTADLLTLATILINSKEKIYNILMTSKENNIDTEEYYKFLKDEWYYEKYYLKFIGRKHEINLINSYFEEETSNPKILMVHALGGVGKTALCRKAVEDLHRNKIFSHILWIQPNKKYYNVNEQKTELFDEEETKIFYGFSSFITHLAQKLRLKNTAISSIEEKKEIISALLSKKRFLIVIDGIEKSEQIDPIIDRIVPILGNHSGLLISSRQSSSARHCYTYELENFSFIEAQEFCNQITAERKEIQEAYTTLSKDQKSKLIKLSTGNPLFLKVLLSHLISLSFERLLSKFLNPEEPVALYSYLLDSSWNYLQNNDELAIKILLFLAQTQSIPINFLYKYKFAEESPNAIDKSLNNLNRLSLIENNYQEGLKKIKLHSFISRFVNLKTRIDG